MCAGRRSARCAGLAGKRKGLNRAQGRVLWGPAQSLAYTGCALIGKFTVQHKMRFCIERCYLWHSSHQELIEKKVG